MRAYVYLSIAGLVLYGDLIKRLASPSVALAVNYALAIGIILLTAFPGTRKCIPYGPEARPIGNCTIMLIVVYAAQLPSTLSAVHGDFFTYFLYVGIPLSLNIVIQKRRPDFDLEKLGNLFLVLMIGINAVGLYQYFVNPTFMVSYDYSDRGGIVDRNFSDGVGSFKRFPSLFVSADRYSAMGLMQFFFSLLLLNSMAALSNKKTLWYLLNLLFGFVALGIAGARSRIMIAFAELALFALAQMVNIRRSRVNSPRRSLSRSLVAMSVVVVPLIFVGAVAMYGAEHVPIVRMMQQTFERGDVGRRLEQTADRTFSFDKLSLFGEGLGSNGGGSGKPGEFGMASIWGESGLIFGALLNILYIWLAIVLAKVCLRTASQGLWQSFVTASVPLLLLLYSLMASMVAYFELSTGMLVACAVAVASRLPPNNRGIPSSSPTALRHCVNRVRGPQPR